MKCSECSKVVKPVVAIDIDGTLGNYHGHFIEFAGQYIGASGEQIMQAMTYGGGPEGSFREHCELTLGLEDAGVGWEQIKLAFRQGGMKRTMMAYHGASWMIARLRRSGAEVWVTTTRPYLRLDGIDPDTRFWLARHAIDYDGLLYDEDKYRVLAENIDPDRVVAVLDDLPEQLVAAREAFGDGVPILRRTRWNRAVEWALDATELDEAGTIITRRIEAWDK